MQGLELQKLLTFASMAMNKPNIVAVELFTITAIRKDQSPH